MKAPVQFRSAVSCPRCRFRRYRETPAREVQETSRLRECEVCGEERMDVYDMERGGVLCLDCPPDCPLRLPRVPDAERVALTAAEEAIAARLLDSI